MTLILALMISGSVERHLKAQVVATGRVPLMQLTTGKPCFNVRPEHLWFAEGRWPANCTTH